jgi:hypothetical protein
MVMGEPLRMRPSRRLPAKRSPTGTIGADKVGVAEITDGRCPVTLKA